MHVHLPNRVSQRFLEQSKNGPYGAAVESVDWSTDVILNELEKLNLDKKTIVIFTSDNGSLARSGGSNDPLRGTKKTCWEGGFRVPCIIRWPGRIEPGRVYNSITTSMDFLPTIAKLTGSRIPDDRIIDGFDISDQLLELKNNSSPERTFFYYKLGTLCAVRKGKYKYFVKSEFYDEALYNLNKDISESDNILESNPDIVKDLVKTIEKCREDIGDDATGSAGKNCRPPGKVDNPKTLTEYNPNHPYMIAMYDLSGGQWG
jgi:arylsulfatase A-like enzyme